MADEVRSRGADFLVIGYPTHLAQLDADAVAAAGIPLLPLEEIEREEADLRWHHDSHFNPEGHRRMAHLLLDALASELAARVPDAAARAAAR